jgi:hypothetical protein
MRAGIFILAALIVAAPAMAQDRDYCPARPGLGDTSCTISTGRVSVESGLADWQRDASGGDRTDTITLGDTLVRIGVGESSEVDFGWTPYVRQRDRSGGSVTKAASTGDVTVAVRQNLRHPDGSGFSIALLPFATLPVGGSAGGAGDWSAGLEVPVSFDLGKGFSLQSTALIAAAVDADRHGRHFAVSEVAGLGIDLSKSVAMTLELEAVRDEDPAGTSDRGYAGVSFAWGVSDNLQLDVGGNAGLNRDAADAEIYAGISRRF